MLGLFLVLSTNLRTGACGAVGLAAMQLGALMGHKAGLTKLAKLHSPRVDAEVEMVAVNILYIYILYKYSP